MYRRDNNNNKNAETQTLMVMTIFVELGYVTASGIQHSTNSIKIPHTKNQSISAHSHSNHHDNCEQANSSQCPSRLLSTRVNATLGQPRTWLAFGWHCGNITIRGTFEHAQ